MNLAAQENQLPLCCPCGSPELYRRGLCYGCYNRRRRDRARFAGSREKVLARDRRLCRACHARLHRLRAIDRWVPDLLEKLWAEQHPGSPRQLQLPPTRL